jgi:hypothetical protein
MSTVTRPKNTAKTAPVSDTDGRSSSTKSEKQPAAMQLTQAERACKFTCYQKSVQSPSHEVKFFEQAYRDVHGSKPFTLREDFCGTFAVCCEWVTSSKKRTAIGVDLCSETIQWGRDNNLSQLKPFEQDRITLLEQDVRCTDKPKVDVLAAQNFSFWIFKTRQEVIEYFTVARSNLEEGGIMVMDMMGGGACYEEGNVDKRKVEKGKNGFSYHWKQVSFNPVNSDARFAISFKFKDGSKLKNAFEYDWRFWTVPEVREMLAEAGFTESHVYFEEEIDAAESNWERRTDSPSDPVWVAYVVAVN